MSQQKKSNHVVGFFYATVAREIGAKKFKR